MVNLDTDIVVMEKNPDKRLYPASTAKIMTALVALENVRDFNAKVECPYVCFDEFSWSYEPYDPNFVGASTADIQPLQENVTYYDCLYALMLASGCEAGNIIAYNVGNGDIKKFISMMNETADKIGCTGTHFTNAHGLFEENNYTTARDMYLITRYAMDNYPGFMKICETYEYEMPANELYPDGYTITHTCAMMRENSEYYYEGTHGIKTGSIYAYNLKKNGEWSDDIPGFCSLVTSAERNGYRYLLVTLQSPYEHEEYEGRTHYVDHMKLYDWAFDEFAFTQIIKKNQMVMQADVAKGLEADKVSIVTTEDYYTLLPKSLDPSTIQQIKPTVEPFVAPVDKDVKVGELELRLNGETLTKIPLVTESRVELDVIEDYKEKLVNILKSPQFITSVIVLVLLIIVYVVARTLHKKKKRKAAEMERRRKIRMAPKNNGKGNDKR
ncbi:MAG: D-alanyl-D-alanine carboxypeptidase [Lachnospiraceae bacterium]|nr:D-alanyl-D-alanine carboxypeptidase [Ruminococcus sp.]MCM1274743.1 D-alanyl-D-alanine carboxypeptidase [Lachnospiraceae bacterium]